MPCWSMHVSLYTDSGEQDEETAGSESTFT